MTAPMVGFVIDGEAIELAQVDPTATLLDFLRYDLRRTGTKEGCAEGDCGACTVLVGEVAGDGETDGDGDGDGIAWRAVNACIQFLPMVAGKAVITVEGLAGERLAGDLALNPLQAVMAANGSSQCGFCTPGFVMALYGRAIGASGAGLPVADVLAGNLCRCTGYGPILAAAEGVPTLARDDAALAGQLRALAHTAGGEHGGRRWFAPRTGDELAEVLAAHPEARIVAGATDVGLWVTKGLREIECLVFIGDIAELRGVEDSADGLRIGAAVRYAEAHDGFARLHPAMGELVRRFAGLQVRNAGTVGGNIANGSPIGDGPPALIALGARVTLRGRGGRRELPLEDYFLDYGKQDRQPGEFVESVFVPRPDRRDIVHISKLTRRFDSDISAVCGAFKLSLRDGVIVEARVAFGGMAATPRRAPACEAALTGGAFDAGTIERAVVALQGDYTPLSDVRGSADYRQTAAGNLLRRLWHAAQGEAVSVLDAAHG